MQGVSKEKKKTNKKTKTQRKTTYNNNHKSANITMDLNYYIYRAETRNQTR